MKGGVLMDESLRTNDSVIDAAKKYADILIKVSFTYVKNRQDAEDIAHDVFLKLMIKRPIFGNEDHRKAWLIRVAINLSKNRLKTSWFRKTTSLDDNIPLLTIEENDVLNAVQQLPVKYRSIIHLFYIEGYSISEVAAMLGRKGSTVGSQLHRARIMLKSKLEEDFDV